MFLKGKKVILRSVEYEDMDLLREMTNDPDIEKMIVGYSFPVSKKDQEEWFQNYKASDKMLRFVIETKEDGAVGLTGLRNIDWKNGAAESAGMRVAKTNFRCKGIATDAYLTMFRYAFEELRLNRISGAALNYNEPSKHVMQKVGFKQEGVVREAVFKNGKFEDVIKFGILKSDYYEACKRLSYWEE